MSRTNPSKAEYWNSGPGRQMLKVLGTHNCDGSDAWAKMYGAKTVQQYNQHLADEAAKAAKAKTKAKSSSDSSE